MKKFKKLVSSILITMLTVATLGSISAVKAASAGPLYLGIVSLRRAGYGYQQEGSKVWKIAEYDSENGKTADLSKTIYCIKGGPGFGSSDMATGGVPTISKYTQKFNLKDLASIPSTYSKILPTGSNYNSLMWLLDNIYIMPAIGTDNTTAREEFLKSKIPNELYELITDDDIDAVQQLAIWYFTNPSGDKYHYETSNFKINSIANVDSNYASMGDIFGDDGWDREDAIEALFQYYITNAKANSNYKSTNNTTSPIEIVKSNATMTKVGSNYVAGPYKINQLLNVDYTLNATFTDINGTTITPSIGIKDVSGNVTATTKTLKELVGQEFYLIMPTSSNISGIKMTVNTSYTSKTVDYWSVADAPTTEQPVVIVNETPLNFSDATSIVVPKPFDLSLRKFITNINGTEITNRIPQVDVSKLASGEATTATYNHTKTPLKVAIGDVVTYTIRVYNEGDIDGYVREITDYLPAQLEYLPDDKLNKQYGWQVVNNGRALKTDITSPDTEYAADQEALYGSRENKTLLKAYGGKTNDQLDYIEVQVRCKVIDTGFRGIITNIAEITAFSDGDGNSTTDRDSFKQNLNLPSDENLPNYRGNTSNKEDLSDSNYHYKGQEDDDDFEKIVLEQEPPSPEEKEFDLALRKFITSVNNEELKDIDGSYTREPNVDVSPLVQKSGTTAIYNHTKVPVSVAREDIVTYTIRVYNEGEKDGYVKEITDHLPPQLEFLVNDQLNVRYGWKVSEDGRTIKTDITSPDTEYSATRDEIYATRTTNEDKVLLKAFNGEELDYIDVQVRCKVKKDIDITQKITNIADVTEDSDENNKPVEDRDSNEDNVKLPSDEELPGYKDNEINSENKYIPGQEDDDDFEKLIIEESVPRFDLALRKFITGVNGTQIDNRVPVFTVTEDGKYVYEHTKEPVDVKTGDVVTYTLRIFNEGNRAGYAELVKDDIPEGLVFLPENKTNIDHRWKMYKEDGTETDNPKEADYIETDYLSKAQEEETGRVTLLKAFNPETMTQPDYHDIKVAFEVTEPNTSDRIIINHAQISEDSDENGKPVEDDDSVPNEWNEGEDDQDIEKIKVKYYDLALRKWVTESIVTYDGKTTVTKTGNTAEMDPEPPAKVEIRGSRLSKTTVKFKFKIRVTNEGEVAGHVGEISDYIPKGLKFIQADNPKWKEVNGKVVTDQLKDTLLQPGDSAEVEIILTWVNSEENLGLMTNIAEISKDDGDDIDSTPDNKKDGEDDQDDAPVILSITTGAADVYGYIGLAAGVLLIISGGIILIKKYVI